MSFTLALYLVDVLTSINMLLIMLAMVATVTTLACLIGWIETSGDKSTNWLKSAKKAMIVVACFAVAAALIPSKTTMYAMIGVQAAKVALESPEGKEITDKVIKIVNSKLDTLVKEAK